MLHFGLIGEKLGHSLSAPIHEAIWRRLGIAADYKLIEIARQDLNARVPQLLQSLTGFNVTIPYKERIIPLLREVDAFAGKIGAVNTVKCIDESGYNTDAPGFEQMLRHHSIEVENKPCYVLGTGGASKAVVAALWRMGAKSVTLVSRKPQEGEIGYETLGEAFSGVLVNTTPVGMWPNDQACPIAQPMLESIMRRATGVADIIYNPRNTQLTLAADRYHVPSCTGLYMLIEQAVQAERIWLGESISPAMADEIERQLFIKGE